MRLNLNLKPRVIRRTHQTSGISSKGLIYRQIKLNFYLTLTWQLGEAEIGRLHLIQISIKLNTIIRFHCREEQAVRTSRFQLI